MAYEDPIGRPDDLRPTDRAMLVALSHHQGDSTPLSPDQERLLDGWVDGRLSFVDGDQAAELAKHNVFAAERVLERRLISAANEGSAVPTTLTRRVLRASRSPGTRASKVLDLRWPTFSGWQWSGLGALAAVTVAIAVFGFQFWQQPSRVASNESSQSSNILMSVPPPAQSFQIAMVTLEDRSVLAAGARRTRGPQAPSLRTQESVKYRDIDIPTDLLQRAITSASNNKGGVEHSELMNFLRGPNDAYNYQVRILIDSALADSLPKKFGPRDETQARIYDLDDGLAANIRSKIKPLPIDGHLLFLTVRT
jgi:hypothetical protein